MGGPNETTIGREISSLRAYTPPRLQDGLIRSIGKAVQVGKLVRIATNSWQVLSSSFSNEMQLVVVVVVVIVPLLLLR